MELKDIKGIGKVRLKELEEKGIKTPIDLLNIFPNKYLDFSAVDQFSAQNSGALLIVKAMLMEEAKSVFFKGLNYTIARFVCLNSNKVFSAVWYGQPYMKNNLKREAVYYLVGKINKKKQLNVTNYFELEKLEEIILPVYGSGVGVGRSVATSAIKEILKQEENFSVLDNVKLDYMSLKDAYKEIHFPTSIENLEAAKQRVTLEDLTMLAALEDMVKENTAEKQHSYKNGLVEEFIKECAFNLTEDQKNAIEEIYKDLQSKSPMNRLVVGDVGSGKTMVAFFAVIAAIKSGLGAIMLCPTEILAKQHYENFNKMFNSKGLKATLLCASLNQAEKKEVYRKAKEGLANFIIATHSALNENLCVPNLSLVITDEQHRFGVNERAKLSLKGQSLDSLVMSATPVPRSLALVLFGGLNVSQINSRPFGESKIQTKLVSKNKENDMWNYIASEIKNSGGKCFVVAARATESDAENEIYSVQDIYEKITKECEFGANEVALIHGKMDKNKIDETIEEFKNGDVNILISTTVIEVGIDVKNANFMVIYNPERFGLATLHQLRGRIGRDGRAGYCFLVAEKISEISKNRLKLFKEHNNGIHLAEEDLKLRGAGTLYGTKQHGANEIFLNINFSLESYKIAQEIFNGLEEDVKSEVKQKATQKFGDIYKKVVLN